WEALLASLAALTLWYRQQRQSLSWGWLFTGGLAAIGLLACTVERTWPGAGYYILLLGWPVYVLLWSYLPFVNVEEHQPEASTLRLAWFSFAGFQRAAPVLLFPCIASILWALNLAVVGQEYLWAAAAVSLCAVAAALLAVCRRSEELAFLAGLSANLATSLF